MKQLSRAEIIIEVGLSLRSWCVGAKSRLSGRFIFKTVEKRDARHLGNFIKDFVCPDTVVCTDQWRAYMSFSGYSQDYEHYTVNHSKNFVNPENP